MTTSKSAGTVSRRTALAGLGAGGLSLALAAACPIAARRASAQEATPGASVSTELGVVYGEVDGQTLMLDVYRPPARVAPRPAAILLYPGGMMAGERSWMGDAAQGLAEAGYVAFSIDYRLFDGGTRNRWPVQLDDAQRAVRWIRANAATYGVDPDRIASYGHSSGAQLAAFLGTRDTRDDADPALAGFSSRVACVVDLAGTMDLSVPIDDAELSANWAALLGGTAAAPPGQATYRDFSPIAFVDAATAPFLILQGGADSPVQIENSRRMEAALRTAGVGVVYGEFPGVDHFAWDWAHAGPWTLVFLAQQLHPED